MSRPVKVMHQKRFFLGVLRVLCGQKNFFEPRRTQRTQREEKLDVLEQFLRTLTGVVISWKLEVIS